ncbi:hypothetical protein A7K91_11730 [Paenibacillus oryzae]|uniref:SLH domain-containing protein n=1 Tax=Paenibacillus oryzae TaxID=1844972 RepID=A0A1A5YFM2_9BACL|nr:S-layer homology domain-containing protein [Paenibacillus oryzae]OBR64195.1 hypothetical protein A7K91_11730 [Paenibacillus oryzae]
MCSWSVKRRLAALLLFSMMLGCFPAGIFVAKAAEGARPAELEGQVLVGTAEELNYVTRNGEDYLDRQIRLTGDIDLSGYQWVPLGSDSAPFSGVFDGRGHQITGVSITAGSLTSVGFFGVVTGVIQNLSVTAQVYRGGKYTGALVGYLNGGSVISSNVQGSVTGGDSMDASVTGGLVGIALSDSLISGSYSSVSVKGGVSPNQHVGGLIGSQGAGLIQNSYSTGDVTYPESNMFNYAGGLAGQVVYGTIANSYSTSFVSSAGASFSSSLGGLVGIMAFSGTSASGSIKSSFFDLLTTGQLNGAGHSGDFPGLTGLTSSEMKEESYYGADWSFSEIWAIHADVNDGYPYLRPDLLTRELPRAIRDIPYLFTLEARDGAGSGLSWSAEGLPPGLALMDEGVIQGIPLQGGLYQVELTATDAGAKTASVALQLHVDEAAPDIAGLSIGPGTMFGSTKAVADMDNPAYSFAYCLGAGPGSRPLLGDELPADAGPYLPGADITGVKAGQFLQLFVSNENGQVQSWSSIQLVESHIQQVRFVSSISLEPAELLLVKDGPPGRLTVVAEPEDATNQNVIWSSSHPEIASVMQNGEILPLSEGMAVVTAVSEDGGYTASATIKVQTTPPIVGGLAGTVLGAGAEPLSGAEIQLGALNTETDNMGKFELANVAPGKYELVVKAAGYKPYSATIGIKAGETIQLDSVELIPVQAPGSTTVWLAPPAVDTNKDTVSVSINGHPVKAASLSEREGGQSVLRVLLDKDLIESRLDVPGDLIINIGTESPVIKVDFPAEALYVFYQFKPDHLIRVSVNGASSSLPMPALKDSSEHSTITAAISRLPEAARNELESALALQGFTMLTEPVGFSFYRDGKAITLKNGHYLEQSIPITADIRKKFSVVVRVDHAGRPYFVPSLWGTDSATLYTATSGWFTVLHYKPVFTDIQEHWARNDIELLGSKLIVDAGDMPDFQPDRGITRAEFAAMLVRALGLEELPTLSSFSDTEMFPEYKQFGGAINAANAAGLIQGYDDGTFRPHVIVTREQMAVMLARAIEYTAGELSKPDLSELEVFSDHAAMSEWAKAAMAQLLAAGIIEGVGDGSFSPRSYATRAQSAVLLARLLRHLTFIN